MILDVGCGVKPKGDVNIDISYDYNKLGYSRPRINHKKVKNFILADGQFLPFKDAVFDKVVSYGVIAYVENPQKFLEELRRVLKNGGSLYLEELHCFSMILTLARRGHKNLFTIRKLRDMLTNSIIGLKVIFPRHALGFRYVALRIYVRWRKP